VATAANACGISRHDYVATSVYCHCGRRVEGVTRSVVALDPGLRDDSGASAGRQQPQYPYEEEVVDEVLSSAAEAALACSLAKSSQCACCQPRTLTQREETKSLRTKDSRLWVLIIDNATIRRTLALAL